MKTESEIRKHMERLEKIGPVNKSISDSYSALSYNIDSLQWIAVQSLVSVLHWVLNDPSGLASVPPVRNAGTGAIRRILEASSAAMTDTTPETAANLSLAKQVCPTCKGTGQTQYSSIPSSGPMIRMVGQWEDCTDCLGTGNYEEQTTIC